MSEPFQPESLSPFEARLAQLTPAATQVDRDEVLFQAGRHAALAQQRTVLRKWYALCAILAVAVCGQSIWIYGRPDAPLTATLPASSPRGAEEESPAPIATPTQDRLETRLVHREEPQILPERPASLWNQLGLPSAGDRRPDAWNGKLSVGVSVNAALEERFLPRPGVLPTHQQAPLSSRNRDWTPQ